MSNVVRMNFNGPETTVMSVVGNKMELMTKWGNNPTPTPINIYRTKDGFIYQDKLAKFVRKFKDADFLRWDFEYPHDLVPMLNDLPIGECDLQTGMFFTDEERRELDISINGFDPVQEMIKMVKMSKKNSGSNYTPPKKKRKKNKKTTRKK